MKPTLKVLSRKERLALQKKGTEVSLDSTDPKYEPQFEPQRQKAREILSPFPSSVEETDPREDTRGDQQVLPTHSQQEALTEVPHTVVSKSSLHTVRSDLLNTPPALPTDGDQQVLPTHAIPLSPLQWRIWGALIEAHKTDALVTYQELAKKVGSTKGGVRDAVYVIQKEGGIREKTVFRQANPQGMRVRINADVPFYPVSTKQAQGVLKRGIQQVLPTHRGQQGPADHPPGMYVCKKNTYIQEQDIRNLLNTCPADWQIREATLVAIADLYPKMNATVFRLSLIQAIRQEKAGKTPVRHHNAWLKAAFEQNGGPLITERDIEAQLAGNATHKAAERPIAAGQGEDADLLLRRYMTASEAERAEIDAMAAEKAKPALAGVGEDHHEGIFLEAKIQATREYFAKKA